MRYRSLLELFDSRIPYTWDQEDNEICRAVFHVGGYDYRATFRRYLDDDYGYGWDFIFAMKFSSGRGIEFADKGAGVLSTSVLGSGNASQVFACVLRIVDEFIERKHPEYITFTADEPSRQSLYRRMVNAVLTRYADYQRVGDMKDDSVYWISRIEGHKGGVPGEEDEDN